MLFRSDEARLELAQEGRHWAFDAPGAEFKLGLEAYRITQEGVQAVTMLIYLSR
jgi:hypothetical protein